MQMLVLTLLTFKKVKLICGHPVKQYIAFVSTSAGHTQIKTRNN